MYLLFFEKRWFYYMASLVEVINYHIIVFYENVDCVLVSCLWQQLLRNPGRHFGLKIIFAPPPILTAVAMCCPFLGCRFIVAPIVCGHAFLMDFVTYSFVSFGPRREKTCLRGFRQSEIQTSLLSYRD